MKDVSKTLEYLRERHMAYYTVYRTMLESGARFEHVLGMIELWNPDEKVKIPGTSIVTRRLICFEEQGFRRYYMGLREETKPCEWVYFPADTLELLGQVVPRHINRHQVRKYAKKHNLVLPKYMRKVAWRLMRVSEARYEDLLSEADQQYPAYLKLLEETLLLSISEA